MTLILLILTLVRFEPTYAEELMSACDLWADVPNTEFSKLQTLKDNKMKELANLRTFTKISDEVFNKMHNDKNKKPIDTWANSLSVDLTDKKKVISTWREHFFTTILIPSFKKLKKFEQKVINHAFQKINEQAFPYKKKEFLTVRFILAKRLAAQSINKMNIRKDIKNYLINRISDIKMEWFHQISNSRYENDPNKYFSNIIGYDASKHIMSIGYLASQLKDSDTITAIFIQEIAHSFDPCRWHALQPNVTFPFQKVTSCLRGKNSIAAKKRGDKILDLNKDKNGAPLFSAEQLVSFRKNPTCNTSAFPLEKDQREQINTTFADWFTAEAMSQKKEISSQFRHDLCAITETPSYMAFPSGIDRLNKIYMANPVIRKKMGVGIDKSIVYCSMK